MAAKKPVTEVLSKALNDLNVGRVEKAEKIVERVLAKHPASTDALQVKAMIHRARGQTSQAIAALEHGLSMRPDAVGLTTLYGSVLGEAGHYEKALAIFEQVLARPQQPPPGVPYNISLLLMTLGRFEDALPLFESRLTGPTFRHTVVDEVPRWQGEDLADQHLLITGEQGLGDQVLFSAFVSRVAAHARRVTLTANPRLVDLFARSFPDIEVISHSSTGPDFEHMDSPPDVYCPAGSVALYLGAELFAGRPHSAYLRPDEGRTEELRARYKRQAGGRPVIGISWSSPRAYLSMAKSMPAPMFGSLFKDGDVFLVNLQYRADPDDLKAMSQNSGVDLIQDETIDPERDMDGVAAQCAAIDHMVSISTSAVHIAGAVGTPSTVLLPKGVGVMWYWSTVNGLQPWYKSVETISQSREGDWSSVVEQFKDRAQLLFR